MYVQTGWVPQIMDPNSYSYAGNVNYWGGGATNHPFGKSMAQIIVPSTTVWASDFGGHFESAAQTDIHADFQAAGGSAGFKNVYRHLDQTNVLFCDGHVKTMNQGQLTALHGAVKYLFTIEED